MAAKRIAQSSINWAAIAERVPPEQKSMFMVFKAKSDSYLRKVVALPEHPPKIEWSVYKGKVPLPAMVDDFQKKYEAFQIPLPDGSSALSTVAAEEKEAAANVKKFKEESTALITQYQAELKKYETQVPLDQMTMEEYAYAYPKDALDVVNNPTYWPHEPEDQPSPDDDKKDAHGH